MFEKKNILCLSPHCDDIEFACGGTVSRMIREGCEVHIVAFSTCTESLPKGFCEADIKNEMMAATAILGIKKENVFIKNFPVRKFSYYRQEILEEIVALKKALSPDLVIVPATTDVHQDHHVINNEAIRVFKNESIIGYEMPWNNLSFISNMHIEIEPEDLSKKIEAISQYRSQLVRQKSYEDIHTSLARVRGVQIGKQYAESFEVVKWKI